MAQLPVPSPWEHLQRVLVQVHNKRVREWFKVNDTDTGDIGTPEGSLLRACLIDDDDSQLQVLNRRMLFWFDLGVMAESTPTIVGTPLDEFNDQLPYAPTVTLFFKQDSASVPSGGRAVKAELTFKLRSETSTSITQADINSLALRIKTEFGGAGGYRWTKGKLLVTYRDRAHGLTLHIYSISESEGIQVIQKICDCAGVGFNNDFVTTHESNAPFPTNPGTVTVLGKARKKPQRRPTATVRFVHATIQVYPLTSPLYLVARKLSKPQALQHF